MTISDKLISINNTKAAIKSAIEAKGVTVGSVAFDQYPSKITAITTGGGGSSTPTPWVRPADWLTLPTVLSTEQKFVGLYPVFDNQSNVVSFRISGTGYTVDWGDGSAPENYASAALASHTYNYSTISDTTISSRGYKQSIITVVPQGAGNITGTDFSVSAGGNQGGSYKSFNWLEMIMSFPYAGTSLVISTGTTAIFPMCERVDVKSTLSTGISAANLFFNFYSLQEITTPIKFASGSTGQGTFRNCRSLRYLPNLDFSTLTGNTYSSMFTACSSLEAIPDTFPETSAFPGTVVMTSMFDSCDSLKEIPSTISNIPASNLSYAFAVCRSIKSVPTLNTSSCVTFTYAFKGCNSLESVTIDCVNATAIGFCFQDCVSLREVNILNTNKVTDFGSVFSNCFNLEKVNNFNMSAGTSVSSMFASCYSLVEVPSFNWSSVTSIVNPFSACYNLAKMPITWPAVTFSIGNCRLSSTELNAVYSNLPVSTGKTITVGGNWGTAGDDPTIASAKGWSVVGS